MRNNSLFSGIYIFVLLLLLLMSCADTGDGEQEPAVADTFTLTILHTNDTHGRILQSNRFGNTVSEEEVASGEGLGGVARRATAVKALRDSKENVLLLDAGDQFQGTLFYSHYRAQASNRFMNMLGYDAMTLGNHEFDDGPEILAEFIESLEFPVVSSNVDTSDDPFLAGLLKPYVIIEIGGQKIGLVGYMTQDVPSISKPGQYVVFNDIEESVQTAVTELQNQEIDIIIALSHAGLFRDKEVAAAVDGLDVIVGGHTHTYLSNTSEDTEGPYPVVIDSPSGTPVLVVTAKSLGHYLGDIDVTFDADGVATEWEGEPILLDSLVPEDEEFASLVAEMNEPVSQLTLVTVGKTEVDLIGTEEVCRHYESNLGDLICDTIRWETQNAGIQIAIFNGGGIRAGIPAGDITMAQVLEVLPFGDTLAYFALTGSDLRETLEYGVSRAENPDNEGTGRFLQVSGLKYTWSPDAPVGSRIGDILVEQEDGTYAPLVDDEIYKIGTLLYIREGGDGYTILEERAIDPYDFGRVISDILTEYLVEFSPIAPVVEGRITRY